MLYVCMDCEDDISDKAFAVVSIALSLRNDLLAFRLPLLFFVGLAQFIVVSAVEGDVDDADDEEDAGGGPRQPLLLLQEPED
jgi:hypothetical protein